MRMGRVIALTIASTVLLWRVLVIGINDLTAIHSSHWIDASIWLAEDPLSPSALWITNIVLPSAASDQTLMYAAEFVGDLEWTCIALLTFLLLRKNRIAIELDEHLIAPVTAVSLAAASVLFAYLGGFCRTAVTQALRIDNPRAAQLLAIVTFIVLGNIPSMIVVAGERILRRRRS